MNLEGVLIEDKKQDTLLYAGKVKVNITDWFFFKDQAELKYIGLEDAVIKLQRTDSVWQQQFMLDYFASPSSGKKKKAGIQLDLKKIELKNVFFIKKDAWLGSNMSVRLGSLNMDADSLNLSGNTYDINSLKVVDPVIAMYNYKGLKPLDENTTDLNDEIKTASSWNTSKTTFKIGELKIVNGSFKSDNGNDRAPYQYFDGEHIAFTEINGDINKASFVGDTIYSKLKLSAKERSGFQLKNLSADLKLTPQGMAFSNMELKTNNSTLQNYFMLSYNDISDMSSFVTKVKMTANFENSYLDSDDIAFFAPAMKTWNKKISLKGKLRGTVDNLVGKDMVIQAGSSTLLNGDVTLTGLPDIDQTFIDFKANEFRTTYNDAITLIPKIKNITSPDLRKLQYINFKGSFTGFIRDFVTFGTIKTNLGSITSDLNMKLPLNKDAVYSGTISTDNFRIGEFLNNSALGSIAMKGTVKGTGFSTKSINTLIDGKVRYVDYNKYRYQNISICYSPHSEPFHQLMY